MKLLIKKKVNFLLFILFVLTRTLLFSAGNVEQKHKDTNVIQSNLKINAFLDTSMLQINEGRIEFQNEFEKLTGIELVIIQPPHQQYMEKLLIQLASGNLPDICEVYASYLPQLVSDKVIIPLDEYIKKSRYMNSIYPYFIDAVKYKDGHIYGIQSRAGGGCITYIRKDWLDNLGLTMPKTWNEFVHILRAFTFDDPDGNGKNDTFGYTEPLGVDCSDWDWYNRTIMLDTRIDIYFKNGKWVDGFQEPGMRDALKRYRNLYEEGVIDKDLFTNTTSTARSKLYSNQVGIFAYWANHWARNLWDRAKNKLGDQAEVVPMSRILGQNYIRRIAPLLVITVESKNPDMVFTNFIDNQYDKGKIQTLFTYGVKGYHWDFDADGTFHFLINPNDSQKNLFMKAYVPPMSVQNDWVQSIQVDPVAKPAIDLFNKYSKQDPLKVGGVYYVNYYSEITNSLKPDIFARIVLGEYTIDEGLALYKKTAEKLHIDDIIAELNK